MGRNSETKYGYYIPFSSIMVSPSFISCALPRTSALRESETICQEITPNNIESEARGDRSLRDLPIPLISRSFISSNQSIVGDRELPSSVMADSAFSAAEVRGSHSDAISI